MKVQKNSPASAQNEIKKVTNLFNHITRLDEMELNVGGLLNEAVSIIYSAWITNSEIAVRIEYNGKRYSSQDFKEVKWDITSEAHIHDELYLKLHIYCLENCAFTEAEQQLSDVLASKLAVKLKRVLDHNEMQENRELLDKAYKLARIGTWEYDMINDKLHWSDVTKEVHGFESDYEPDVESTVQLFKEGYHRDTFAKAASDAIEREKPFDVELKIISGKGDERWIRATGFPEYKNGKCTRFYGISQNVTEWRKAEEEVELNDRRFKALVRHGMDMIAILNEEGDFIFVSPTSLNVLGIPAESFNGENAFDHIHEADRDRVFRQFTALPLKETTKIKPFRYKDANEEWKWLEATITNLTDDHAVKGYVVNSRDITERQIKQEQIIGSLREKETLLSEIHHRIKNNLSVLTGLLQLQATQENNEEVINRLFDSVARIQTMASIHEQLYQSNNFGSIELGDRLQLLAINIKKSFQSQTNVELNFQCEPTHLPVPQALPCSLIANEVITNIFKHAFKGRPEGTITIELSKVDVEGYHKMQITDNGVGLPEGFKPDKRKSLGVSLINMLAGQLHAEYSFESTENGTVFTLLFKKGTI